MNARLPTSLSSAQPEAFVLGADQSLGQIAVQLPGATAVHRAHPEVPAGLAALYAGVNQLQDDLVQHIHLENNLLFTQFEAVAPARSPAPCCGSCGG